MLTTKRVEKIAPLSAVRVKSYNNLVAFYTYMANSSVLSKNDNPGNVSVNFVPDDSFWNTEFQYNCHPHGTQKDLVMALKMKSDGIYL